MIGGLIVFDWIRRLFMSEKRLRYSGWSVPFEHWSRYPCWEFALDEETEDGQDETMMRPCERALIDDATDLATGEVVTAKGERFPCMIGYGLDGTQVTSKRVPNVVRIYWDQALDGRQSEVNFQASSGWSEFAVKPNWDDEWVSVSSMSGAMPMKVTSMAPLAATNQPLVIRIEKLARRT